MKRAMEGVNNEAGDKEELGEVSVYGSENRPAESDMNGTVGGDWSWGGR